MDGTRTGNAGAPETAAGRKRPRRCSESGGERGRYFLPKPASSAEPEELGRELASEGEAPVQAFKSGQLFYTLIARKTVPKMKRNEPKILKEACSQT